MSVRGKSQLLSKIGFNSRLETVITVHHAPSEVMSCAQEPLVIHPKTRSWRSASCKCGHANSSKLYAGPLAQWSFFMRCESPRLSLALIRDRCAKDAVSNCSNSTRILLRGEIVSLGAAVVSLEIASVRELFGRNGLGSSDECVCVKSSFMLLEILLMLSTLSTFLERQL